MLRKVGQVLFVPFHIYRVIWITGDFCAPLISSLSYYILTCVLQIGTWRYDMILGELTAQAMLCDFAEVSGNKLFISGAGINMIGTGQAAPPHPVSFALALLVHVPWTATNQQHTLKVQLFSDTSNGPKRVSINDADPPDGNEENRGAIVGLFNMGRSPVMQVGEESLLPITFPMFGLPLPDIGSYYFIVSIDGTEVDRVSFRVTAIFNTPGFPATATG